MNDCVVCQEAAGSGCCERCKLPMCLRCSQICPVCPDCLVDDFLEKPVGDALEWLEVVYIGEGEYENK